MRPCLASSRFHAKSPYLSSPASGKPEMREMHADLVRATGLQFRFEQGDRRLGTRPDAALGAASCAPRARRSPRAPGARPRRSRSSPAGRSTRRSASRHLPRTRTRYRLSTSPSRSAACRVVSAAPLLGDQQHAGRVAIQPVDEFEERGGRTREAQPLDHPEADAAAAVDREAGRFVESNDRVVLVQDRRHRSQRNTRRDPGCATAPPSGSAVSAGGRRLSSRVSGPARRRLSRTSPLRRIR